MDDLKDKRLRATCNGYTGTYNSCPEIKFIGFNEETKTIDLQVKDTGNDDFWLDVKIDVVENPKM